MGQSTTTQLSLDRILFFITSRSAKRQDVLTALSSFSSAKMIFLMGQNLQKLNINTI